MACVFTPNRASDLSVFAAHVSARDPFASCSHQIVDGDGSTVCVLSRAVEDSVLSLLSAFASALETATQTHGYMWHWHGARIPFWQLLFAHVPVECRRVIMCDACRDTYHGRVLAPLAKMLDDLERQYLRPVSDLYEPMLRRTLFGGEEQEDAPVQQQQERGFSSTWPPNKPAARLYFDSRGAAYLADWQPRSSLEDIAATVRQAVVNSASLDCTGAALEDRMQSDRLYAGLRLCRALLYDDYAVEASG